MQRISRRRRRSGRAPEDLSWESRAIAACNVSYLVRRYIEQGLPAELIEKAKRVLAEVPETV
jgi:hypothetical protein